MFIHRTRAIVGVGLALSGCCCRPRTCCVESCAPPAPLTLPVVVLPSPPPPPQPATRSRDAILEILDGKHIKGAQFTDTNLDQFATYLRTVTGIEVRISAKVRTAKFEALRVNIPIVDDITARQLLDLVVAFSEGLVWNVREGVVHIEMPGEAAGP